MKSIKKKILLTMSAVVFIALIAVGVASAVMSYVSTLTLLEQTMTETAEMAAASVEHQLNTYTQISTEVGSLSQLARRTTSAKDKQTIIDQRIEKYGFTYGGIVGSNGIGVFDGLDYSQEECFQRAMQGQTMITDPVVSEISGGITVMICAPLWEDGIPDTKPIGMVFFVPPATFLDGILAGIQVSDGSGAYILNSDGDTIAIANLVGTELFENVGELAKTDSSLVKLAELEHDLTLGNSGFGSYTYGGSFEVVAYSPIHNTNGWGLAISAPRADFMSGTRNTAYVTVAIVVVAIAIAVFCSLRLANAIGIPLKLCAERLSSMVSEGDLHSSVPPVRTKDEIGLLLGATAELQQNMQGIIGDIDHVMAEMASGNFVVDSESQEYYKGDFEEILVSMRGLRDNMDGTLRQIEIAAEQVDAGSDQVASGAQELSQGATEQASSTEELAATVNEINVHVHQSGEYAAEASSKTEEAGRLMQGCTEQMTEMLSAMDEISHSSEEIAKIIKTIEDIAFQTNILALNAAVEAARAGAAGKGFAVVADEVRNLAAKSAEASKNTAGLIEASVAAVGKGVKLANGTAEQLAAVSESAQVVMQMVAKITASAKEQAASIEQVTTGLDQISAVVQTNSATAEQSAAASEELSSQAAVLKDLVERFRLSDEMHVTTTPVYEAAEDYVYQEESFGTEDYSFAGSDGTDKY